MPPKLIAEIWAGICWVGSRPLNRNRIKANRDVGSDTLAASPVLNVRWYRRLKLLAAGGMCGQTVTGARIKRYRMIVNASRLRQVRLFPDGNVSLVEQLVQLHALTKPAIEASMFRSKSAASNSELGPTLSDKTSSGRFFRAKARSLSPQAFGAYKHVFGER